MKIKNLEDLKQGDQFTLFRTSTCYYIRGKYNRKLKLYYATKRDDRSFTFLLSGKTPIYKPALNRPVYR